MCMSACSLSKTYIYWQLAPRACKSHTLVVVVLAETTSDISHTNFLCKLSEILHVYDVFFFGRTQNFHSCAKHILYIIYFFPYACNCAAAALSTILRRWGLKASPGWNISGELCSGVAVDDTDVDNSPTINPGIKCDCSYDDNTVCHITKL